MTVIGVDSDQGMSFEKNDQLDRAEITPTSMLKRVDISLYDAVKAYMDGTIEMGKTTYVGLEENCVGLANNKYYEELVPADVKEAIDAAAADIASGKITVVTALGMEQEDLVAYRDAVS